MAVSVEQFKPLNDQVVVLVPKIEEKTKAGMLKTERMIADEASKLDKFFKVVSVGEKVTTVVPGQYILPKRQLTVIPVVSDDESVNVAVIQLFDIIGYSDEQ